MKLSVIIVNYNVKYFIEVCLHSVQRAISGIDGEIIVIDNNSKDGSCELIRSKYPNVRLIENKENAGFSKANNQGVAIAKGEYILFLNPDTVMPESFLQKQIEYLDNHSDAGSIGPRLIDGRGKYAPDGKKSFPSLSVAIFKTTGINKIFSKSTYFNKYYAVHVGEYETAEVDMLSGCCMMVRKEVIGKIGGAFDESYFMYCEDFDLSYRIKKAGYKNIYYPETTLIHYKGESTRKATISHVRIFNEALTTFVKKHYTKTNARLFILLINVGIVLRAILSVVKQVLKVLRMPMFDALVLLGVLTIMTQFWVEEVKNIAPIPFSSIIKTFPVYILLWTLSMYFNGVYDQSYRAIRVVRGMTVGTIVILAYFGLLPADLRYSRAIIIFTGFIGTVSLLGLHGLLYRLGIFKFIPYEHIPGSATIVGNKDTYQSTANTLMHVSYAPELLGRISATANDPNNSLAKIDELKHIAYSANVEEIIFCVDDMSYSSIFEQMKRCGTEYEYKIHISGSNSFVGSNSSHTAGDLYTIDKRYNLAQFAKQRNKRILDVSFSLLFLTGLPLLLFIIKQPINFIANIFNVLIGNKTWVGYDNKEFLPKVRKYVLPTYNIQQEYTPEGVVLSELNKKYAESYSSSTDIKLILDNLKYLGGF